MYMYVYVCVYIYICICVCICICTHTHTHTHTHTQCPEESGHHWVRQLGLGDGENRREKLRAAQPPRHWGPHLNVKNTHIRTRASTHADLRMHIYQCTLTSSLCTPRHWGPHVYREEVSVYWHMCILKSACVNVHVRMWVFWLFICIRTCMFIFFSKKIQKTKGTDVGVWGRGGWSETVRNY